MYNTIHYIIKTKLVKTDQKKHNALRQCVCFVSKLTDPQQKAPFPSGSIEC